MLSESAISLLLILYRIFFNNRSLVHQCLVYVTRLNIPFALRPVRGQGDDVYLSHYVDRYEPSVPQSLKVWIPQQLIHYVHGYSVFCDLHFSMRRLGLQTVFSLSGFYFDKAMRRYMHKSYTFRRSSPSLTRCYTRLSEYANQHLYVLNLNTITIWEIVKFGHAGAVLHLQRAVCHGPHDYCSIACRRRVDKADKYIAAEGVPTCAYAFYYGEVYAEHCSRPCVFTQLLYDYLRQAFLFINPDISRGKLSAKGVHFGSPTELVDASMNQPNYMELSHILWDSYDGFSPYARPQCGMAPEL